MSEPKVTFHEEEVITKVKCTVNCPFCGQEIFFDQESWHGYCSCHVSYLIARDSILFTKIQVVKVKLPELFLSCKGLRLKK